jgi:replicative DNA helicase
VSDALENPEAEAELLGALLVFYSPEMFSKVRAEISEDSDWYDQRHRIIWRAICAVSRQGSHVDTLTVASFLEGQRSAAGASFLELAGGKGRIELLAAFAVGNGVVERARIVAKLGEWRRRLRSCLEGAEACRDQDEKRWREAMGDGPRLRVVEGGRQAS